MPKMVKRAGKPKTNAITSGFITLNEEDKIVYISDELSLGAPLLISEYLGETVWDVFPLLLFNGFYEEIERIRTTGCRQYNSLWLPAFNTQIDYSISPAAEGRLIIDLSMPL